MSVNDLAVCGAQPIQFLDYIACGTINDEILHPVIDGVVRGCEIAGCVLTGGETAEMPGMYAPDEFDLAGFAIGIVEADEMLPNREAMRPGDQLLGIPSSGIHSNGFSLLRATLDESSGLWESLLAPTRIYADELRRCRTLIKGAAHITGGGLEANLARVLPDDLVPQLSLSLIHI